MMLEVEIGSRTRGLAFVTFLAVLLAIPLLLAGRVQAANVHKLELTESLAGNQLPIAVAVNQANHHFYVTSGNSFTGQIVYNFDEDGQLDPVHPELTGASPFLAFDIAVDNSGGAHAGYIYEVKSGAFGSDGLVQQFDPEGNVTPVTIDEAAIPSNGTAQPGGLPPVINKGHFFPRLVTVDGSGDVFVSEESAEAIDVFNSAGVFVRQVAAKVATGFPEGIAVSGNDLYIARGSLNGKSPGVYDLNATTGQCVQVGCTPTVEGPPGPIAFDRATGTIYLGNSHFNGNEFEGEFTEYAAATGDVVGVTHPHALHQPGRIAVDETSGRVIVLDALPGAEPTVKLFGPPEIVPDLVTLAPDDLTDRSITLKGEVGAAGEGEASCAFQYASEEEFKAHGFEGALEVSCEPSGPFTGSALHQVESKVIGLMGGTNYHERIVGENEIGFNSGKDIIFTTKGPKVSDTEATEVHEDSATLKAAIDPKGLVASYRFQYLPQSKYEASGWSGASEAPAGGRDIGLSATGTGNLKAGTFAKGKGSLTVGPFTSGSGNISAGSNQVTSLKTDAGAFAVGQPITGEGIPVGTTITAVGSGALTISAPATEGGTEVALAAGPIGAFATGSGTLSAGAFATGTGDLSTGSNEVTLLDTNRGSFEAGQPITGEGIPAGTTIIAVGADTLTLSAPAGSAGTGVDLAAGSILVTSLSIDEGSFEAGQPITGEGIPAGTTIIAVGADTLTLSAPAGTAGTGVDLAAGSILVTSLSIDEGTFEAGQPITGDVTFSVGANIETREGIPDGTTVAAIYPGTLVLSNPAKSSGSSSQVALSAGSTLVTSLATKEGAFGAHQAITGPGIPREATVHSISVGRKTLVLSAAATQTVSGVALQSTEPLLVSQRIEGLSPLTTYRVRLVAQSTGSEFAGETDGEEVVFATFAPSSATLPDGRRYEQASPIGKDGTSVQGSVDSVQASSNGERITFSANSGIPGGEGAQNFPTFMATRAPEGSGWSTQGLLPSATYGPRAAVVGWTEELSSVYDFASRPFVGGKALLRTGPGVLTQIGATFEAASSPLAYAGSSKGGGVALLESSQGGLLPGKDREGKQNVYAYGRETGELTVAGILNDGTVPAGGAMAGPYNWFEGGSSSSLGGALSRYYTQQIHAISTDGSKVFFTAGGTGQLYVRLNPLSEQSGMNGEECIEAAKACTVRVSAPEPGVTDPGTPAAFLGASPDGDLVYFLDKGKLTKDSTAGEGSDLYRYDLGDGSLTDLTIDSSDKAGARVEGMLGIGGPMAEDAYFVAAGKLAGGATQAPVGETNLYALHGDAITYITRLGADPNGLDKDFLDWTPTSKVSGGAGVAHQARVSSDGQTLLFRSLRRLTSSNNASLACGEGREVRACTELYLYRAGQGISCISCNPTQAPEGRAGVQEAPLIGAEVTRTNPIMTRNLSPDGRRTIFDSADRLLSSDHNHVNDVYEWEAQGKGSCESEDISGGCIYLISGGAEGAGPSWLGDVDESGNNVFFFTSQRLVAQDQDELVDVYDARVGGGIASQEVIPAPACEGEVACRSAAQAPPGSITPGSSTFSGPGNLSSPSACKKGQVRIRGKCVRKQKKQKHKKQTKKSNGKGKRRGAR